MNREAKQAEGKQHFEAAEKWSRVSNSILIFSLKTSLFKWAPDFEGASGSFEKAGNILVYPFPHDQQPALSWQRILINVSSHFPVRRRPMKNLTISSMLPKPWKVRLVQPKMQRSSLMPRNSTKDRDFFTDDMERLILQLEPQRKEVKYLFHIVIARWCCRTGWRFPTCT